MTSLITERSGRWLVQTETSAYVLDLDAMTCLRYPGMGGNSDPVYPTAKLRRDAEPVPLLSVDRLELGESMVLSLGIRGDGIPTQRTTTPVRHCRRVAS